MTGILDAKCERGLATFTLRRASRGNALTSDLVEDLLGAFSQASSDPTVRMIALRGEGKHFCTGFDLDGLELQSDGDLLQRFVRIETLLNLLWHAPKRTVAIATGRTWGAGADIIATCDDRLADCATRFRFPGANFGIVLGMRRLAARVGDDLARLWVTESTEISAEQALAAGLLTDIVEPDAQDAWIVSRMNGLQIDHDVVASVHRASRFDRSDTDLAELVRSAAEPGLRQRIQSYVSRARRNDTP